MLSRPVAPRETSLAEKGKMTYYGVCSGCHAYGSRLIGPPVNVIQAMYKNNPKGIADYIANPIRKREDFPEMPPQNYLTEETRNAVAEYVLTLTK
jgi:mono/diheme cytochrome c family protein